MEGSTTVCADNGHNGFTTVTTSKMFPCKITGCDKRFSTPSNRDRHERCVHSSQHRRACPICDSMFARSDTLKVHIAEKHSKIRNFKCSLEGCSASFLRKEHLQIHERSHTQQHPFSCNVCDARFKQRVHLTAHLIRLGPDHLGLRGYQAIQVSPKHRVFAVRVNNDSGVSYRCHVIVPISESDRHFGGEWFCDNAPCLSMRQTLCASEIYARDEVIRSINKQHEIEVSNVRADTESSAATGDHEVQRSQVDHTCRAGVCDFRRIQRMYVCSSSGMMHQCSDMCLTSLDNILSQVEPMELDVAVTRENLSGTHGESNAADPSVPIPETATVTVPGPPKSSSRTCPFRHTCSSSCEVAGDQNNCTWKHRCAVCIECPLQHMCDQALCARTFLGVSSCPRLHACNCPSKGILFCPLRHACSSQCWYTSTVDSMRALCPMHHECVESCASDWTTLPQQIEVNESSTALDNEWGEKDKAYDFVPMCPLTQKPMLHSFLTYTCKHVKAIDLARRPLENEICEIPHLQNQLNISLDRAEITHNRFTQVNELLTTCANSGEFPVVFLSTAPDVRMVKAAEQTLLLFSVFTGCTTWSSKAGRVLVSSNWLKFACRCSVYLEQRRCAHTWVCLLFLRAKGMIVDAQPTASMDSEQQFADDYPEPQVLEPSPVESTSESLAAMASFDELLTHETNAEEEWTQSPSSLKMVAEYMSRHHRYRFEDCTAAVAHARSNGLYPSVYRAQENVCPFCSHGMESVLVSTDATLLVNCTTFMQNCKIFSAVCRECSISILPHGAPSFVFVYNLRKIYAVSFLLEVREHMSYGVSPSVKFHVASTMCRYSANRQDTLAYFSFETVADHSYIPILKELDHHVNVEGDELDGSGGFRTDIVDLTAPFLAQYPFFCVTCSIHPFAIGIDGNYNTSTAMSFFNLPDDCPQLAEIDIEAEWSDIENLIMSNRLRNSKDLFRRISLQSQLPPWFGKHSRVPSNVVRQWHPRGDDFNGSVVGNADALRRTMSRLNISADGLMSQTLQTLLLLMDVAELTTSTTESIAKSKVVERLYSILCISKDFSTVKGRTGGTLDLVCPHQVSYGLAAPIGKESGSNVAGLIAFLKEIPLVILYDAICCCLNKVIDELSMRGIALRLRGAVVSATELKDGLLVSCPDMKRLRIAQMSDFAGEWYRSDLRHTGPSDLEVDMSSDRPEHPVWRSKVLLLLHDRLHGAAHYSMECRTRDMDLVKELKFLTSTSSENNNRRRSARFTGWLTQMHPRLFLFAMRLITHQQNLTINLEMIENMKRMCKEMGPSFKIVVSRWGQLLVQTS
eukprot:GILJ01016173.1.p1 GENE.GILJ01016173.1~~GILJ01016173.1.p1  ORF type:complete len:1310 (-),score=23.92 GILJ01016173.1:100-4029(-)